MTTPFSGPLLILLAVSCLASTATAADQPTPGNYQVKTNVEYVDLPMPATTVTTENCLSQEDLDQDPQNLFSAIPADQNCQLDDFKMSDGVIDMSLNCKTPDGDMTMHTSGTFTENEYNMTSNVIIAVGDKQMKMLSQIHGTRLGDC